MSRIRITGGTHRSRLIQVPDLPGLRPTPDRVRATLFNWLGNDLGSYRCLDLFAGSGILGFEAASRGAAEVVLVEQNPRAIAALKQQIEQLHFPQARVWQGDALKFAAEEPFDLLFLDPPYGKGWLDRIEPLLGTWLAPDAWIYAEAEQPLASLGAWKVFRQGHAGQVHYHLLQPA